MSRPTLIVLDNACDFVLVGGPSLTIDEDGAVDLIDRGFIAGADVWSGLPDFGCCYNDRDDGMVAISEGNRHDIARYVADAGYDVVVLECEHTYRTRNADGSTSYDARRKIIVHHADSADAPTVTVLRRGARMQVGLPTFRIEMPDPENDLPEVYAADIEDPSVRSTVEAVANDAARAAGAPRLNGLVFDIDGDRGLSAYMREMSSALCAAGFNVIEVHTEYLNARSKTLDDACKTWEREREYERQNYGD